MKVAVSGSTGLIGEKLVTELRAHGHEVTRIVRGDGDYAEPVIRWNPSKNELNPDDLEGIDAVINLNGEPIADVNFLYPPASWWTDEKKRRIVNSRVRCTKLLAETMAKMDNPPKAFLSGSAIGFYGKRGDEELTEVSKQGANDDPLHREFLPDVCRQWEDAADAAREKGIRVATLRTGVVLSDKGGALKAMYIPFRLGVAGNLGWKGEQWMSWISLADEVGGIIHVLENDYIAGPVNLTSPNPLRNRDYSNTLRRHLNPIAVWAPPLPGLKLKLMFGQMADEILLSSTKAMPVRLQETGYQFKHPTLKECLKSLY